MCNISVEPVEIQFIMPLTIDLEDLAKRGYKFGPKFLQLDSCTQFYILRPLLEDPKISLELFGTDDPWNLREPNQCLSTSDSSNYQHTSQDDDIGTYANDENKSLNMDELKAVTSDLKSEESSEDTDAATVEGFIKNDDYEQAVISKIMNETLDPSLKTEIGVNTVSSVFSSFRTNFYLIQEYITQKYSTMPEDDDISNLSKPIQRPKRRKLLSLSEMDSHGEN